MTMAKLTAPTRRAVPIAPVRPNVGTEIAYQAKLDALIGRMSRAVERAVRATWRAKPPVLASDESSPAAFRALFGRLGQEWERKFSEFAQGESRKFAGQAVGGADRAFAAALRKAGFTVKFRMTPAANEVMQATIAEQVGLIKSIPEQYLTQVQGAVMRSVQVGRDLGSLATELQDQFGVTKRRAALIARTQNNMATAAIVRARQDELGITKAVWLHSAGGRQPRRTHVANNGKVYDVQKGWFDPDEGKFILPGQLINCFPADTVIGLETRPTTLWRAAFNGPMIHVHIGADLLKGTPNHPILTTRGWVGLGSLNYGDQVVCMAHQRGNMVHDHEHQGVTTIGDLFEACCIEGIHVRSNRGGFHFYGDVSGCDIDEVIVRDHHLSPHRNPATRQDIGDLMLSDADGGRRSAFLGGCDQVAHADIPRLRDVGPLDLGRLMLKPFQIGGASVAHQAASDQNIAHIPSGMARRAQPFGNGGGSQSGLIQSHDLVAGGIPISPSVGLDADRSQLFAEFIGIAAKEGRRVFEFGAAVYELRSVTDKVVRDFAGHVFTMATCTGYYSVGDMFAQAKNCRCVSRSIVPGLD